MPDDGAGRDGRRERAGPHALEPARGDPQGDRPRPLPADLDRPLGGERHRDAAPGPDPGTPADPRPVRRRPSTSWACASSGSSSPSSPTRRSTPASILAGAAGTVEIDARPSDALALAVRAGRPDLRRRAPSWSRPASEPTAASTTTRARPGCRWRRPARRSSTRGSTSSATSSTRSTSTRTARAGADELARRAVGRRGSAPRGGARVRRLTHMYSRSRQKSRTARRMTDGLRPSADRRSAGSAARRPRRSMRPAAPELDQELRREEGAVGLDADVLERRAPEELAGAVDIGHPQPEEDPVREPVGPRVGGADRGVGPLDPEPDDDIGRVRFGRARGEPPDVRDLELAVAIGERDEVVARGREARAERGAIAQVGRVVDDPHEVGVARSRGRRRGAGVASRDPSSTAMISNVSASDGSVASASPTRPSMLASSLWAGKKYERRAARGAWVMRRGHGPVVMGPLGAPTCSKPCLQRGEVVEFISGRRARDLARGPGASRRRGAGQGSRR